MGGRGREPKEHEGEGSQLEKTHRRDVFRLRLRSLISSVFRGSTHFLPPPLVREESVNGRHSHSAVVISSPQNAAQISRVHATIIMLALLSASFARAGDKAVPVF